ncbi:relaxase/mobilization nuclease domain-containing protein [Vibrio cyclitrophicus]
MMIFKECKPRNEIQTDLDILQTLAYAARADDKAPYKATKDEMDDTELDANQLLNYSLRNKTDSESTYVTSNELDSAVKMVFKPDELDQNWGNVIDEFVAISRENKNCKQHMKHFVLSLPPNEDLDHSQWTRAAHQFMKDLGYEDCKWIAFKHDKESNPHLHIVVSRINVFTKKVKRRWGDWDKAFEAVRKLEKEFELTQLASPGDIMKPEKQKDGSIKMVPNDQGLNGKAPHKEDIARRVTAVHSYFFKESSIKPTLSEWMLALREAGVGVQLKFSNAGKVSGMSYRIKLQKPYKGKENYILNASSIGYKGRFGFKKITEGLAHITDEQLNLAREISARETRMRDDKEKDIIAFKKLDDIRLLSKKVYDVQIKMSELHFSKHLLKMLLKKRNFRVHRRNGSFVVSRRFEIKNLEQTSRMTGSEYRVYLERKWAEMIIEKILEFFGFYTVEVQPPALDIKFAEALLNDEYQNLFGFTNKQEYHPEGRKNEVIDTIDLEKHIKGKQGSGNGTKSTARALTIANDLSPSL